MREHSLRPRRNSATALSFPLLALPLLAAVGCPGDGPTDGGALESNLTVDGAAYRVADDSAKLLVKLERISTAGVCAPTHGHAAEASTFAVQGDLSSTAPADSTLTLTVPAAGLVVDLEANRALYEDLADEAISGADRERVQGAMGPEVSDNEHPNLVFTFSNLSSLEAGTGRTFDAVATIKGITQSFTFTFDVAVEGEDITLSNGQGTISRETFGILTSNPFGGCLADDILVDLRSITFTPGAADGLEDAGAVFEQQTFPFEGDCVDDGSAAWDTAMYDILGKRCLGCHQADSAYPLATYDDWRVDSPTEPGRPRYQAAHDLMRLPLNDSVHMPPQSGATQLPQTELDLVFAWFDAGAPPACEPPDTSPTFTAVTRNLECGTSVGFAEDIAPMITGNFCQGCHDGVNPDLPAINDDYLTGVIDAQHPFYQPLSVWEASVERVRDLTMPPLEGWGSWAPTNGSLEADLAVLDQWVAEGYPATACTTK